MLRNAILALLDNPALPRPMRQAIEKLPKTLTILGTSKKVEKGLKRGVLTAIVYLSPSKESGVDVCPWASRGCAAACLGHSAGQLSMPMAKRARLWKTAAFLLAHLAFRAQLDKEIRAHAKRAQRLGLVPAVRFDGSSDTGFGRALALLHPDVQFYDYTKEKARALAHARGAPPANYHVTFSRSESNEADAIEILREGGNVAVVFATRDQAAIPSVWNGFPVLNGDETDVRFEDPRAHVVALTTKGTRNRTHESARATGFAVAVC